jgi:hypothetical protein
MPQPTDHYRKLFSPLATTKLWKYTFKKSKIYQRSLFDINVRNII